MFYILGLFLKKFQSLSCKMVKSTLGEALLNKSVKSVPARVDLPKPKLHASLSLWMEI
jgi:hypothetical protein